MRRSTRLVKKMEYILYGMIMDKNKRKAHIKSILELEYGHGGMIMEKNGRKEPI